MNSPRIIPGLVSTIIPVYNRPKMLVEAVASVFQQKYPRVELLIVNDGSTDDTTAIAEGLRRDHRNKVTLIHTENKGPGGARELGRMAASGEYVQYLDSDDILYPGKFARQVEALQKNRNAGVAYCKTRHHRRGGDPGDVLWRRTGERFSTMFPQFLVERVWGTLTPLYRRDITDKAGPWTELRQEEDWEYDCRIASLGTRLVFVDEVLADVRRHDGDSLCLAWMQDTAALRDRARARELIYQHALNAGISTERPEMQNYSRQLFHLSRQCGCAGLKVESRGLFDLARQAAGEARANGIDFRLYRTMATVLGWRATAVLSTKMEYFRNSPVIRTM